MNIIETNLRFGSLSNRSRTSRIIIHNAAAVTCSPEDIHRWHLANGWSGAGYHFLVRKDGSTYRLRPEGTVGAHAQGSNSDSIGICFEGNYDAETSMPAAQMKSGKELVAYLKSKYGISRVQRHRDVCATSCPGNHFPFNEIAGASGSVSVTTSNGGGSSSSNVSPDNWVSRLQSECNAQGFSRQKVDGIPGPNTLAGCPTIGNNAKGKITALLQERLNAKGFNCGKVDGINGPKTKAAITAYQRSVFPNNPSEWDGIAGQKTWRKLLGL